MFQDTDTCISVDRIYTAFSVKREPDFSFPGESHSFWELVYVIDGIAGVMAGGNIYELKSGDIIFHKPFEFHRIWSAGNTCPSYMVISFDFSGPRTVDFENKMFHVSESEMPQLTSLTEQIAENITTASDILCCYGSDTLSLSKFVFTLELLLVNCIYRLSPGKTVSSESSVIFKRVVRYMEENIAFNPANDEFAAYANVSLSSLKRIFLGYSCLGVHQYFLQLKMMEAQRLLRDGASVCEVAGLLEFSNQNNFSAAFKRTTGVSPSRFK